MKYLPKLTMRDLLWLMALVALSVLWWMDRQDLVSLQREVITLRQQKEFARLQAEEQRLEAQRRLETAKVADEIARQFEARRKSAQDSQRASE